MNFVAAINKHAGLSSSDVVIKCRNALSKAVGAKIRCGHMGTLDPAADGVLVLGFGKATRLFDPMQVKTKTYVAEFTFGKTTDTLDRDGKITQNNGILPDKNALFTAVFGFLGDIKQTPPAYSAISINGVRAYNLARQGKDVEIPQRTVTIHSFKPLSVNEKDGKAVSAKFEIVCGSGTYIRSLCRDLAAECGCIAYMSELTRTACGPYCLDDCVTVEEFVKAPLAYVRDPFEIVRYLMPCREIDEQSAKKLLCGVSVPAEPEDSVCGLTFGGKLLGTAKAIDGMLKLETYLWED